MLTLLVKRGRGHIGRSWLVFKGGVPSLGLFSYAYLLFLATMTGVAALPHGTAAMMFCFLTDPLSWKPHGCDQKGPSKAQIFPPIN